MRDTLSSLIHSLAGENSKETIRQFVPLVQSSMHVLSVTHVWSVQIFLLIKYANLLAVAKNME